MAAKAQKAEIEELKKALERISLDMAIMSKQQTVLMGLMGLMEEIKQLKTEHLEKDKKIATLESRVVEMEQYSRLNNIIISGLVTKPRSYARAAALAVEGGEPTEEDTDSIEQQVITYMETKGINIDSEDLEACHPLPKRDKKTCPDIILRFVNRKHKLAVLKQGKKLKGSNVYMNEHLTKKTGDIAKQARRMRKQEKIQSTWTANCKVYIKLNGETPEEAKVLVIRALSDLDKYDK